MSITKKRVLHTNNYVFKKCKPGARGSCLLTPATQEAEIRRIVVQSQPKQIV
jgi:hypothetical protein